MKYGFLNFQLDTDKHEFRVDGDPRPLEPQVFDLLTTLVEHRDRLISRDELLERVWSGRIVSDATIDARVNAARKAVGDDGAKQSVIKTIPRRGFRFVAQVTIDEARAPGADIDYRSAETTGGTNDFEAGAAPEVVGEASPANEMPTLELPEKPSIAVLPFDNMSGDLEQGYLADGLAEDIITALSKISSLFVIARNSTFAYKGKAVDVRNIAGELGVRYVVEGSVRKAAGRLRITAQLIDASSGSHLWAERYDRIVEDIFNIQDEITQEITTTLQVRLTEGEQVRLRRRQTTDLAAWDHYVRARTSLLRFTFEENMLAREQVNRSLQLDPEFAAAWALLAWTYLAEARVGWSESSTKSLEQGADAALKALEIDESEVDGLAMFCAIRAQQRRYEEAEEAGKRAIFLSPSAADHYVFYAVLLNFMGRASTGSLKRWV